MDFHRLQHHLFGLGRTPPVPLLHAHGVRIARHPARGAEGSAKGFRCSTRIAPGVG